MIRKILCVMIACMPVMAYAAQNSCVVTTTPVNFGSYDAQYPNVRCSSLAVMMR